MAEELESNITVTRKQSIARVELFTDAAREPSDWILRAHFEDGLYDAEGKLIGSATFGTRVVERRFGDIKDRKIEVGKVSVTVAQLAALIQAGIYDFRAEDIAAPNPMEEKE